VLALVNIAIYDATVAAWDGNYIYNRSRPSESDPSLRTVLPNPSSPAYPAEPAVAAGAASAVDYPSDVAAGLDLGRAVAARVIERARNDGADIAWTGTMPTGPGIWYGDPLLPGMGNWKTWILESGGELRPGPPPAFDSAERASEIAEVKNYPRDSRNSTSGQRTRPADSGLGADIKQSDRLLLCAAAPPAVGSRA
jgi:hypothetical protein